jgi:uncharacterized membrane protein YjgN (DUF898 family)
MAVGQRVQFNGDGGKLLVTYLMYLMAPLIGVMVVGYIPVIIGTLIAGSGGHGRHASAGPAIIGGILSLVGGLIIFAGSLVVPILFINKFLEFYYANLTLDGQPCRYVGTMGSLAKVQLVNSLLISITFGIYSPWAICKLKTWIHENVEVGGQRGRLTFHGEGGALLGKFIVGYILMMCTGGIYGAWFANDVFEYLWTNTKVDGRGFGFKKDPGGFLGTYILTMILSYCTAGIYYPWGICNILKWEAERVT